VAAYSIVPLGTNVTVRVARPMPGTFFATVPDLNGMTESQANAALASVALASAPTWVIAPGHPLLRVYYQSPPPGTSLPIGSAVAFRIAKAFMLPRPVPNLSGMWRTAAIAAATAAGFDPDP